jgi:Uncharacterized conserved protein
MKGIVVVDHGSKRTEANEMMRCVANLVQAMSAENVIVRFAHMELAPPTVAEAFTECVVAGADEVIVFPYMLSPGRHSTADIPRMVAAAANAHPGVRYSVTHAFGVHEKLAELVLMRAGVAARELSEAEAARCWDPNCSGKLCGDACRAHQTGSPAARDSAGASR